MNIKPKYRNALPQLGEIRLLTDDGLDSTLIFNDGIDLPLSASFHALKFPTGYQVLRRCYNQYARQARVQGTGFVLDSATWRASRDWGDKLDYSVDELVSGPLTGAVRKTGAIQ